MLYQDFLPDVCIETTACIYCEANIYCVYIVKNIVILLYCYNIVARMKWCICTLVSVEPVLGPQVHNSGRDVMLVGANTTQVPGHNPFVCSHPHWLSIYA